MGRTQSGAKYVHLSLQPKEWGNQRSKGDMDRIYASQTVGGTQNFTSLFCSIGCQVDKHHHT